MLVVGLDVKVKSVAVIVAVVALAERFLLSATNIFSSSGKSSFFTGLQLNEFSSSVHIPLSIHVITQYEPGVFESIYLHVKMACVPGKCW